MPSLCLLGRNPGGVWGGLSVGGAGSADLGVVVLLEDHADEAVRAALDMRRALDDLNRERDFWGKPDMFHGIGIHSGSVLSGNSGSEEQSSYALIGDTVNIASRIQGLTKDIDCDILMSRETLSQLHTTYQTEEQPPQMVRGYSKPIVVYKVLS